MEEKIIFRASYLDKIRPFIGKDLIKIISGQRRIGKSYMLKQLIHEIKKDRPEANIIYIDKELDEFSAIRNSEDLHNYVKAHLSNDRDNFLFVDEVQEIEAFQRSLRSFLNKRECDIYCTGSNASMLSGELATLLAGRYIEFSIHGLSYPEFLEFNQANDSVENLNLYLTLGGMPFQYHLGLNSAVVFEYLNSLYSTILLKDVISRENIRNVSLLENLVSYVADNIGCLFSAQNISKYLRSQQINIPPPSVISYLKALSNAYFIHRIPRADIRGLKIFEVGEKVYFEDLGLRNSIRPFNYGADIGKLMENAVYLHLIRNGYKAYVGRSGEKEIDFMAERNGERIYVQVAYRLTDENVIKREFGNLVEIPDNYPKYVVTMDDVQSRNTYKGVMQTNLRSFLKESI